MTAAPNFAYALFAKRLRNQAEPGQFDLSTLRFALSGAEPVEPADVEDLLEAGKAIRAQAGGDPACLRHGRDHAGGVVLRVRRGLVVTRVDTDLLAALRRAVPATKGNTRRLASLGPLLKDLEARIVDEGRQRAARAASASSSCAASR